jgi:hypothetical protein
MKFQLENQHMMKLVRAVFNPGPKDRSIGLITDIPNTRRPDNTRWKERRDIVQSWYVQLKSLQEELRFNTVSLLLYENVESNNADLPDKFYLVDNIQEPVNADLLAKLGTFISRDNFLSVTDIIIAPTEYSATAPLKMLARRFGFRAATMPGFSNAMIPALGLDYERIHERVLLLKNRLDKAVGARVEFLYRGSRYDIFFDLRYRTAHASSGLIHDRGTAGNLPSGEAYIVPYEGELENDTSKTGGILPITVDGDVILCKILDNRVYDTSGGEQSIKFKSALEEEPARGNISELGLGVLGGFGIQPSGSILLDEKLGLHVAFGRSDHFGGVTGPQKFKNPKNVIHQDYVYVPSLQPHIKVASAILVYSDVWEEEIMKNGVYVI